MTTIEWIGLFAGILIGLPLLGYLFAKMFSEGWFRGKIQAERLENDKQHQPKKGNDNNGRKEESKGP